jgi:hypothetical protein
MMRLLDTGEPADVPEPLQEEELEILNTFKARLQRNASLANSSNNPTKERDPS